MRGHQIAVRMAASGPQPEVDRCALKRTVNAAHDPQQPVDPRTGRQLCSGCGHSRPQRELTVSATFRSSRRQRDRDADDRFQGSADVARRICVARWFPERQLNRCRGH